MIKVKVIKSFYVKENSIMYLDKDRYEELLNNGVVEKVTDDKSLKDIQVDNNGNDKSRILSE